MSSNALTIFQDGGAMELAPEFQQLATTSMSDDLSGGVGGNYAIVSVRGKVFRIKFQGQEAPVLNEKDEAVGSLEAVIVKANPHLTKQYYPNGYEEGSSEAPTCFSLDGKVPSPDVENPQHNRCDLCPQNRFGSRVTDAGKKVKACSDNRKLAIVPLNDLRNEAFGGPMLFRVSASALKDLAIWSQQLKARGYPYNSVAVRIGFDVEASFPKPTFRAIRALNSDEAAIVLELYQSDLVERVLADFNAPPAEADTPNTGSETLFEQPPQPQPQPAAQRAPAPQKPATQAGQRTAAPAQPKPAATAQKPAPAVHAQKPAAPKPAARKPVPPPPPAAPAEPEVAEGTESEVTEGAAAPDMGDEINNILAELNSAAMG